MAKLQQQKVSFFVSHGLCLDVSAMVFITVAKTKVVTDEEMQFQIQFWSPLSISHERVD